MIAESWIQARTKENTVLNFIEELQYMRDHHGRSSLNHQQIRMLKRQGIIYVDHNRKSGYYSLTPYALALLKDQEGS